MTQRNAVRLLDRSTPPHIVTLILIAGLSALSMNIFLPSLPGMTRYFHTNYRLMQLSVALYLAVNAGLQIIVGPISDRYGRRPVLLWGLGLFVAATLGCILAPTVALFLAFRMAQAVVITGLVLSRAVVRDMVPGPEAASMIGYVTMGMAIVPMLGPAVGGVLDETFDWRASFVLLMGLGLGTWALVWRDLGETAAHRTTSLAEQFRQYPELLTSRRFWGYCLAAAFSAGSFYAYLGGAPYVGEQVFGLAPATLGVFFGAPAVGYALGNFFSGRYSTRVGLNRMILAGALASTTGLMASLLLAEAGHSSASLFFGSMTFVGLGNGMVLPNATSGMLSTRPHLAGTASGLGGAILIGGGAALSAISGSLLTPGSGALPLQWIMLASSALAIVAILFVMRRAAALGEA